MNVRRFEIILIFLITMHSTILGVAMLFQPSRTLIIFGWNYQGATFFPSQTGLFLLLFAGTYFATIWHRGLIWLIIASKTSAVVFLISEYLLLGSAAPLTILVAALLDGLMAVSIVTVFIWQACTNKTPSSEVE